MKMDRSGRTLEDYRELFWEAEKTIKELEAKLDAVKNGLYLPKITPEIEDLLQGSYLIENGDWTQDAVEFVCILAKAIAEPEKQGGVICCGQKMQFEVSDSSDGHYHDEWLWCPICDRTVSDIPEPENQA